MSIFLKTATLALVPFLIVQGLKVKKNTLRLPEPQGEREGESEIKVQRKSLSILILGDSAAAGVGVAVQDEALLGAVKRALSQEYNLQWRLHARSGDDTEKVIQNIQNIEIHHYDVVLISVGVNDVIQLMSPKRWVKKQQKLYALIQTKFSPKLMIATGVPPLQLFPALPHPLGWLLGKYAQQMNIRLAQWVESQKNIQFMPYDIEKYAKLNLKMAEDGFHPSREIYQFWGQDVAQCIQQHFSLRPTILL